VLFCLFPQLIPESPRYLIFKGKQEKAKKVLSLIAKVNRKPPLTGRLVTAEEKEQLLEKRDQSPLLSEESETNSGDISYGTVSNMEISVMTDLTILSSDNEFDSELLLDKCTHRRTRIINKLIKYYHWIEILFKNGWWRTTLLLWFIWWGGLLLQPVIYLFLGLLLI